MLTSEELDELIERSNSCDFHFRSEAKLLESLQELKARRESDLLPATKFLSNTVDDQMVYITEEYAEVYKAFENYTYEPGFGEETDEAINEIFAEENQAIKYQLAEKLVDLQTSAETMLAIMGLSEQQRREVRQKVIEKNKQRGYYQEKVSE